MADPKTKGTIFDWMPRLPDEITYGPRRFSIAADENLDKWQWSCRLSTTWHYGVDDQGFFATEEAAARAARAHWETWHRHEPELCAAPLPGRISLTCNQPKGHKDFRPSFFFGQEVDPDPRITGHLHITRDYVQLYGIAGTNQN